MRWPFSFPTPLSARPPVQRPVRLPTHFPPHTPVLTALSSRPRLQLLMSAVIAIAVGCTVPLPSRYSSAPSSHDQQTLVTALESVHTIPTRPRILGYSRERFGHGWGTHVTASGQFCTTRQILMQATFSTDAPTPSPAPITCGVKYPRGVGPPDPYTGKLLQASHVDVDHIVPLSAAWDLGAYQWDEQKRVRFANDMQWNLVVVDSTVNRDKSDATLSEWMPPAITAHCSYAARFVAVVARYELALPEADIATARKACAL